MAAGGVARATVVVHATTESETGVADGAVLLVVDELGALVVDVEPDATVDVDVVDPDEADGLGDEPQPASTSVSASAPVTSNDARSRPTRGLSFPSIRALRAPLVPANAPSRARNLGVDRQALQ
jgi:hypothetical protein